ncbi:L-serine ammonia-lyase, iron-sulfur-dependent subunit beta [Petroclostridium sp. X23]|uniref:L-serine ammonia-lyase, iron-sulfur-dependent subunit beta n=1 Tax=Petroclostridium sp. X23 TaxID=3045146 RepID=UPI0024AE23EF|nr:L-serine ammonia-lyase, iron-sulfur-dependent subunit beta [Petroclostridium sp. X23]WHH57159.1 L-serine ammonia-lyase, iron-sulfur-dependent subunit beta [Petroclostridium sp. X23]
MNVFDIIGPVMIGPSSSHTAGAVRIGNVARNLLCEEPAQIEVLFSGSFAQTYIGHGTDKATVAGILGMKTDDERIPDSLNIANERNISVIFRTGEIEEAHPNTMRIILKGVTSKTVNICGSSIGGGNIIITEVDGMKIEFTGQYTTLIIVHHDVPGLIACVTNLIAGSGVNIANMKDNRLYPNGDAKMLIETDQEVSKNTIEAIYRIPSVHNMLVIKPVYDTVD